MIVAFSVQPTGEPSDPALQRALEEGSDGASVHDAVAAAVRVVRDSGLPTRTSSMFTEIEGEWDEVMDVVKRATVEAGRYGSRVSLVLKADLRPGHEGELDGKVERMEAAVDRLEGR
ncbi:thiamine-binding protein [Brachybacterium sp. AOP43-C2-M15]|uniref:thiamine-binding protein n=1 Tax=Brachybacterium sp. AOP43-C2-M15 TaxID=3457661 RepID=UPI004034096D